LKSNALYEIIRVQGDVSVPYAENSGLGAGIWHLLLRTLLNVLFRASCVYKNLRQLGNYTFP